jgi:hypothetical protein
MNIYYNANGRIVAMDEKSKEFELEKVKEKIQSLKDELKSDNVAVLNKL